MSSSSYCFLNGRYTTLAAIQTRPAERKKEGPRKPKSICVQCGFIGAPRGPMDARLCVKCYAKWRADKEEADIKKRCPERLRRSLFVD